MTDRHRAGKWSCELSFGALAAWALLALPTIRRWLKTTARGAGRHRILTSR